VDPTYRVRFGRIFCGDFRVKTPALVRVLVEALGSQVPDGPGQGQAGNQTGAPGEVALWHALFRALRVFLRVWLDTGSGALPD
jgi:hypothetical protein